MSALNLQAVATANTDTIGGTRATGKRATDSFDTHTDIRQVADAALTVRPKDHQVFKMDTIRSMLRNFLDNLILTQPSHPNYLDGVLSQWLDVWKEDRSQALLIYVLGYDIGQYEGRTLGMNYLYPIDLLKTRTLERQCSKHGVRVHLAKMTSDVYPSPDNVSDPKTTIRLHEVHDLERGLLVDKPFTVKNDSLIQKSLLRERYYRTVADRGSHPPPCEGSPVPQTGIPRSYHDWVLLIMPQGHQFKFLVENADPLALHEWIRSESTNLPASKVDPTKMDATRRWGLTLACNCQLNNIRIRITNEGDPGDTQAWYRQPVSLEVIVSLSLKLKDPELFGAAITMDPVRLSLAAWKEIGSLMDLPSFLSSYRKWLNLALYRIESFQDRYMILFNIREGCGSQSERQENLFAVENWFQYQIEQALKDTERVEEHDAAILVTIVKKFPKHIAMDKYIRTQSRSRRTAEISRILVFAERHSSNHRFTIEFAFSLYDGIVEKTMDIGRAKSLLAGILSFSVPKLCVRSQFNWSLQPWCSSPALTSARDKCTLHADRMARLLYCCLAVGLYNELHLLLWHYYLDAHMADVYALQFIFLPYLKRLLKMMHDYRIPLTTQCYQWQFQQIVSTFIVNYIGMEPLRPRGNFSWPPLGCTPSTEPYGCPTCKDLDAFLADPRRQTADISGPIDAPEHLTARLEGKDHLHISVIVRSTEDLLSATRITKTKPSTEMADAIHDRWRERVINVNELLQDICGDEQWKELLGDWYSYCMELQGVMRV